MSSKANDKQVGGNHYKAVDNTIQHWDFVAANGMDYFQGQITKYVTRWKKKNGIIDLEKAMHFLEKYIELEKIKLEYVAPPTAASGAMMPVASWPSGIVYATPPAPTKRYIPHGGGPFGYCEEDENI